MQSLIHLGKLSLARAIASWWLPVFLVSFLSGQSALGITPLDSLVFEAKGDIQEAIESWDTCKLQQARNLLERLLHAGEKEWLVRYYLAYADYRLSIMMENKELAKGYLEDGITQARRSIKIKDDFCEPHALLSCLYGLEISFKPELAITNGIKSSKEIERARELDPDSPRVHLIDAIGTWHRPEAFGGGRENALKKLLKAVECYEKEKAEPVSSTKAAMLPSWGAEEVHVWIGRIRLEMGEKKEARASFLRALKINSNYGWAKKSMEELEGSERSH